MKPLTAYLLLIVCGFLVFGNTINNDFNLDDGYYTNGNSITAAGLGAIPSLLENPTLFGPRGEGFDYRPVTAISFAIQHQFLGDSAAISHFINLVLYLISVLVLYRLLQKWINVSAKNTIAFWISLLFLLHPLHTEIVASIKSRDEILSLLFCFLSLLFAHKYVVQKGWLPLALVFVFFGLALFSKYTVLPFILLLPLSLYFFSGLSFTRSLYAFAVLFAFTALCHLLKTSILSDSDHIFSITENGLAHPDFGWWERIGTSFYVMGRYLLLHLLPIDLVVYYGYSYVPVVELINPWAILSAVLHASLGVYCLLNFKKRTLVVFGSITYLVFMLVYSNLIELSPGMMAERFTYASSLGFCMALAGLLFQKAPSFPFKASSWMVYGFLITVATFFGVRSHYRNADWKDRETLYAHDVRVAPNSATLNYLYGDLKLSQAMIERKNAGASPVYRGQVFAQTTDWIREAESYFQKVLQINPKDSLADASLVNCALHLQNLSLAEERCKRTIEKFPTYWYMFFLMGVIKVQSGKPAEAISQFKTVITNDPPFMAAYEQLHRTFLATGDTAAGIKVLDTAIRNFPRSPVAYAEMANYHISKGRLDSAIVYAEKAAILPPLNRGMLEYLVRHFQKIGNFAKAEEYNVLLEKLPQQ